ncbi:hypothetical protein KQX54_018759 [Cotesia glomerata]|uniref:Gustatory receptor n=1 Tax=Cotesia glomerata TaxID=32391 RepID=A0AAV7I1L7_COTGL|nr:hypothetical protein KQX54_018759 [Cotesia glomerata]
MSLNHLFISFARFSADVFDEILSARHHNELQALLAYENPLVVQFESTYGLLSSLPFLLYFAALVIHLLAYSLAHPAPDGKRYDTNVLYLR